jgi:excisionase family DNA binding protein
MKIQKHYDIRELAEILKLSVWGVRSLIYDGRIAFTRIGHPTRGRIRISEADLAAFLERSRIEAFGVRSRKEPNLSLKSSLLAGECNPTTRKSTLLDEKESKLPRRTRL